MSFESVTDEKLNELRLMPKRVSNPQVRTKVKAGHEQVNYLAINADARRSEEAQYRFTIYVRQNCLDPNGFSCGLLWQAPGGESLTLARYNGANHRHDPAVYECHIHRLRESDLNRGKKAPVFVEVTDRYRTADGALHALVQDFNIAGIATNADHPDLFDT